MKLLVTFFTLVLLSVLSVLCLAQGRGDPPAAPGGSMVQVAPALGPDSWGTFASTDKMIYKRGQMVKITTITVADFSGQLIPGCRVEVHIVTPAGNVVLPTLMTDQNGTAVSSYNASRAAAPGTYYYSSIATCFGSVTVPTKPNAFVVQ